MQTDELKPRLLDGNKLLEHLEVEQAKLMQLYPGSEHGLKKLFSRLWLFIKHGEFDAPAPSLARYRERLLEWMVKNSNNDTFFSDLVKAIESGELEK